MSALAPDRTTVYISVFIFFLCFSFLSFPSDVSSHLIEPIERRAPRVAVFCFDTSPSIGRLAQTIFNKPPNLNGTGKPTTAYSNASMQGPRLGDGINPYSILWSEDHVTHSKKKILDDQLTSWISETRLLLSPPPVSDVRSFLNSEPELCRQGAQSGFAVECRRILFHRPKFSTETDVDMWYEIIGGGWAAEWMWVKLIGNKKWRSSNKLIDITNMIDNGRY